MSNHICSACGKQQADTQMNGVALCQSCAATVEAEANQLRADGKPVNVAYIARRIFRETHSAGNYLLRDIPNELWTQARHAAIDKHISLRDLLLDALRVYLDR